LWLGGIFAAGYYGNLLPFFLIPTVRRIFSSGITGLLMAFMPLADNDLAHYFVLGERP